MIDELVQYRAFESNSFIRDFEAYTLYSKMYATRFVTLIISLCVELIITLFNYLLHFTPNCLSKEEFFTESFIVDTPILAVCLPSFKIQRKQ